jgi:hypothetical protein
VHRKRGVRARIQERIRSGIAAAKARGKQLGRQLGQRPKSDRLAPKVVGLVAKGRSYRLVGREVGLSKNTVADIVKRHRAKVPGFEQFVRRSTNERPKPASGPGRQSLPLPCENVKNERC